jgi:hypothetical protein
MSCLCNGKNDAELHRPGATLKFVLNVTNSSACSPHSLEFRVMLSYSGPGIAPYLHPHKCQNQGLPSFAADRFAGSEVDIVGPGEGG